MRRLGLTLLCLAAVLACPGQRRSLSREALMRDLAQLGARTFEPVPDLDEVQRLRVPSPPDKPPPEPARGALARARHHALIGGDLERAAPFLSDVPPVERALLRCLVLAAEGHAGRAAQACSAAVDGLAADARALGALGALLAQREHDLVVDELVDRRASRWLSSCASGRAADASCAELAYALARARQRAAERRKDEAGAVAAVAARGALKHARVAGPFAGDGVYAFARAGIGRALEPLAHHYVARRSPWDGELLPAQRGEAGLYRVELHGEGRGPATVFLRSGAAARVAVDGVVVLERTPGLTLEPRVSRAGIELSPGWHRVELLVAASTPASGVAVSFLDDSGRPALREGEPPADVRLGGVALRPRPSPGEDPEVEMAPQDDLLRALLADHAASLGVAVSGAERRAAARALLATHGASPVALVQAAARLSEASDVSRAQRRADAAPLWARVLERWPTHPLATAARAEGVRADRPVEALALYRALRAARPQHPVALRGVADLAGELGLVGEAVGAARAMLRLQPGPPRLGAALAALHRAGQGAAAVALERRVARQDGALYSSAHARQLLDDGETDAAIRELERLVAVEEGHPAHELLWDLLASRSPTLALARVDAVRARFPNDRSAAEMRAQLVHAVSGPGAARAAAAEGAARFGDVEQLWRMRDELGEPPPWVGRLATGDRVLEDPAARTALPGYASVLLVDHVERHLFDDGAAVHVRHFVVRLDGKEALDAFGELSIPLGETLLRLRVVKPDGRVLLPEIPVGVQDVSLTGIAPGDILELLGVSFLGAPRFSLPLYDVRPWRQDAPVRARSYELHLPASWLADERVRLHAENGAPEPEVVRDGARAHVRFAGRDLPPLFYEPHAPHPHESVAVVGWSVGVSEEAWRVARGLPLLLGATPDPLLTDVALRVAGEGTSRARFARLFRFVARRVTPADEPTRPVAVLAEGRGVRTPLLFALARAAGLDARPVGIDGAAAPPPGLPNPARFGLAGVEVRHAEGASLALVDDGVAVLDELPASAAGSRLLDLSLDPLPLHGPPPIALSPRPVRVQLDLDLDEDDLTHLRGFLALTVPAYLADPMRRGLRAATEAQRTAAFERALAPSLPGVRVLEVRLPNAEWAGAALGVGVVLEVPLAGQGVEPVRFDHLFRDGAASALGLVTPLSSYLAVGSRERPVLLSPAHEVLQLELSLPAGGAFTEVPPRLDESAGAVRLKQRAEVTDGTLFWTRQLDVDLERIPAAAWPEEAERLAALAAQSDARVAFVIPR